jgi:hypothetical protein
MKSTKIMRLGALLLLAAATASAAPPYFGADLGTPTLKGSVLDNGDGTLSITGGGADIWGTADSGYFYYTWATGQNWDAKMQITGLTGPDGWTKCELMVRLADPINGPAANDAFMAACLARDNNLSFQARPQRGGDAINPGTGATRTDPEWLRIIREGAKFTIMVSIDNQATWVTNRVVDTAAGNDGFSTWPDAITIGVAVTAHNNDDPSGGIATVSPITGNFGTIVFPTAIGATVQPTNQTVLVQSEASFAYVTTNNTQPPIPSLPIVAYQWYKNGIAQAGATTTIYTLLAAQADNGAQIYCKATVNPPFNATLSSLTSDTATLTVNASTEYSGLKSEFFRNASRTGVEAGAVPKANWLSRLPGLDDPGGYGDNYVNRVSGWWTPTVAGNYVFYVAADDDTDVYLSTDANPANKRLIAQELNWLGTRGWTNDPPNRSSVTFTNGDGSTPWASGIALAAGTKYYIEAVHHNGGGGDNLAVTYRLTTETEWTNWTTNGAPSRLTNGLSFYTWPATTLVWASQPTNTGIYDLSGVTFRTRATTDSELAPRYQWYRNGAIITNATADSYTINPVVFANNNNDTFFVVAKTDIGGLSITSQVATLTVLQTVFEPGFAKVEMYRGVTDRMRVENGTAGDPTFVTTVPMLGAGTTASWGSDYTRRLSAYFIPPTTGAYDFFIASDDDGDFFLSTDDKPANKRIIANETGWSGVGSWVTGGTGGSVWSQKRSDQYTNAASADLPVNPNGIQLTGGSRYYTEIVMHQGGGGDNVEGLWKLHSAPDPVNGAPDNFVGNVIGAPVPRCSYVAFTNQPASQTAAVMSAATFTANGVTDSTTPIGGNGPPVTNNFMFFQWYKNGVPVAGANQSTLRIDPVLATDNGAQISCRMRALGYQDNAGTQLWSNSLTATLTVPQTVFEPGWSQFNVWAGKLRVDVENGNIGTPTSITYITDWAHAGGLGDNYSRRFMGYFVPPTTDNYVLFFSADDDADLFLSTDDTVANKRLVAQQVGYANATLAWQNTGGNGDTLATRRTDQFINPTTGTPSYPSGIPLVAGRKYYLEAVHHNGGGGDYCSVTAITKTEADNGSPFNNDPSTLTGNSIGTSVPQCSYVLFTQQPQDVTVTNLFAASFTVAGTSDSVIRPGGNPVMLYQWYKNGTPVVGATRATYTIAAVDASDDGVPVMCAIRSLGYGDALGNRIWSNSVPATLHVINAPPTFVYAGLYTNLTIDPNGTPIVLVDLTFSKKMNIAALLNTARYTINGGLTITEVLVNSNDFRHVALKVTGTPVHPITVSFNGLTDANGNPLAPGTSSAVSTVPLNFVDIGMGWGIDPVFPSTLWTDGAKDYTVVCQGSDIHGSADGFNYLYETKTGDFDVVVRQKSITHSSQWAKGGLMVRETLEATSRNWNIVNTPLASDGIMAPDNSGYGSSAVECNTRNAAGAGSGGWDFARGAASAYPNAWVRLKRTGQLLSAFISTNGITWTLAATNTPSEVGDLTPLPATVFVGICSTAHNNDAPDAAPPKYYNTAEYADYNSAYVPMNVVTVTARVVGNNLQVSWTPNVGHLVSSPALGTGAVWTSETAGNPVLVPMTGGPKFFKVYP